MALKTMTLKDKAKKKTSVPANKSAKDITTAKAKSESGAQASGVKKKRLSSVKSISKAK